MSVHLYSTKVKFPSMQPSLTHNTDEQQNLIDAIVAIHQVLHQRTPESIENMRIPAQHCHD